MLQWLYFYKMCVQKNVYNVHRSHSNAFSCNVCCLFLLPWFTYVVVTFSCIQGIKLEFLKKQKTKISRMLQFHVRHQSTTTSDYFWIICFSGGLQNMKWIFVRFKKTITSLAHRFWSIKRSDVNVTYSGSKKSTHPSLNAKIFDVKKKFVTLNTLSNLITYNQFTLIEKVFLGRLEVQNTLRSCGCTSPQQRRTLQN